LKIAIDTDNKKATRKGDVYLELIKMGKCSCRPEIETNYPCMIANDLCIARASRKENDYG